jgi:FkbM family methyltransferase
VVESALVHTVLRLAPPTFVVELPVAGSIELRYDERIGLSTLIKGSFEAAETDELCRHARPGTTAVDAGANVGLITIPLAHAVGERGRVLAFEPAGSTAHRLRENVRRNELANVTVVEAALGRTAGEGRLELAPDAAYNTLATAGTEATVPVRIVTLDAVWQGEGRPDLSVLKIDVEGSELDVLNGATAVLRSCRPTVMVELAEPVARRAVEALLAAEGYRAVEQEGFQPWNRLFLPEPRDEPEPLVH